MSKREPARVLAPLGACWSWPGRSTGGGMSLPAFFEAWWRRAVRWRGRLRAGSIAAGVHRGRRSRSGGQGGWSERARGLVGGLEGGRGGQTGGEAQDDLAGVVDDAGGDAEQHPTHELGLAADARAA